METKRKALGKGLEQLFSNERIDFDNFEKTIVNETKESDIVEIPLTEISFKNKSFSSSVTKPYKSRISSLTYW